MQATLSNANAAVLRAQVTNRKVTESQVWRRKQGKSHWMIFLSSDSEERHKHTMYLSLEEHGWERRESTFQKNTNCHTLFFWAPKLLQIVIAAMKLKDAYSLEEKLWPT